MSKPVQNFILLTILIIIGVLVNPESWGFWGKFVFKLLDLGGIALILYLIWKDFPKNETWEEEVEEGSPSPEKNSVATEILFFENKGRLLNKALHQNPEIVGFLRRQFSIIWNLILPQNGYLFLMLPERALILIHKKRRQDLNSGKYKGQTIPAIDLIDNTDGFLLENHIENGRILLPFYEDDNFEPKSFLGIRSSIDDTFRFYWLFDADVVDFFNDEDRPVLHKINETILAFVHQVLLAEHASLEQIQASKLLTLSRKLLGIHTINGAVDIFTDFLINEFQASKLTLAFRTNFDLTSQQGVIYYAVGLEDPFQKGDVFPLEEGLNGWVILKNRPYLLDDIDKGEYFIPRFNRSEKSNYGLRSFLSVPIHRDEAAVGMITLEDKDANKFTQEDKKRLIDFAGIFSGVINRLIEEKQIGGQING